MLIQNIFVMKEKRVDCIKDKMIAIKVPNQNVSCTSDTNCLCFQNYVDLICFIWVANSINNNVAPTESTALDTIELYILLNKKLIELFLHK